MRIGNGFRFYRRSKVARSHCLAQFLGCIAALTTRLIDGDLCDRHINHVTSDKLTSFEGIHRPPTPLQCDQTDKSNGKSPAGLIRQGFPTFKSLAVTYSCMPEGHTTIGAQRFHFRVRNGIGWFPPAIAARQTGSRTSVDCSTNTGIRKLFDAHVTFMSIQTPTHCSSLTTAQADWVLYGQASRAISTG
jgi:hypothetical protein